MVPHSGDMRVGDSVMTLVSVKLRLNSSMRSSCHSWSTATPYSSTSKVLVRAYKFTYWLTYSNLLHYYIGSAPASSSCGSSSGAWTPAVWSCNIRSKSIALSTCNPADDYKLCMFVHKHQSDMHQCTWRTCCFYVLTSHPPNHFEVRGKSISCCSTERLDRLPTTLKFMRCTDTLKRVNWRFFV
jgi:hypothetical protein